MRKGRNIPTKQSFAVVVDGETEYWYLQMLKHNEPNILFSITPKILQKKNIDQQYELVTELSEEEYDKVFWIVDLDVLLKEEREKKNSTSSLRQFLNYYKSLSKQNKVRIGSRDLRSTSKGASRWMKPCRVVPAPTGR